MKKINEYQCEKCEETFNNENDCQEHEVNCSLTESRWCYKCDKTEEWSVNDDWAFSNNEGWHYINLGQMGYGSGLDGSNVDFVVCDHCLRGFINTFSLEGQEKIINSGSNTYLPTDIWLRKARGELTDEEYEEYGMYSPRQRKAYQERFPVCANVHIVAYEDGSRGSRCHQRAHGDGDGTASEYNISAECFECRVFKKREDGTEIPVVYKD
jgi:hypothetical protein